MKRTMRILILIVIGAAVAISSGCGSDESREDANDVPDGHVDKSAPDVIAFNNKFPNVESKCDSFVVGDGTVDESTGAGHRIYATTEKQIIVVPDPTCPGWTPETAAGFAFTGGGR